MSALLHQQWTCYKLQLKVLSTSAFEGFLAVLFPLMFATAALLVYRVRNDPEAMQYAGLGAAVMGMWTAQGVIASSLLTRERWAGTLELVVAAPVGLGRILVPTTMAMSTIGLYCVVATLAWERWVFDLRLEVASWPLFVAAVLMTALTLALVGYFLAVTAVRYRYSWALGAALEYPGWILCGFLIPVATLPVWVQPLSWAIPTTWGMAAVRSAADGGSPWADLAMCAATGAAYAVLAAWLGRRLADSARRHATLALT
ncbi:ABC transporter permease [Nocardioides dongkuii]|uniref:ABC transporter permease n=1 Tax=Nocardioides dongkuii TaxID=2760089 RepID=UPI0015FB937B|nr:ABC transporter permease [Nocardioides dongkuii]